MKNLPLLLTTAIWSVRAAAIVTAIAMAAPAQSIDYVIHISVDGLRSDGVTALGASELPNFYRLRAEGAFTDNARTDPNCTVTMPNHVCMLTGRGQMGPKGHNVTRNRDPGVPSKAGGGISITAKPGEFVRGSGALRIDDGTGANYVAVNGTLITGAPKSNAITVMSWFRFEDIDGNGSKERNFLWETAPGSYPLSFGVRSDIPDAQKHTQWHTQEPAKGGNAKELPDVSDGEWHNAAVVIDEPASQLKYYFDGRLIDDVSLPKLQLQQAGAERFFIGSHRGGDGSRNWDGFIDDMAVFDHAVSPTQIAALFEGTLEVKAVTGGKLRAYWTFDADYSSAVNNDLYAGTAITAGVVTVHSDCAAAGGDQYVQSVFDVVRDHGLNTGFYAGWDGFNFLNASWNAEFGAPDAILPDNGTAKIGTYVLVTNDDLSAQTTTFIANMTATPHNYSLIHWHRTDARGHGKGWMSKEYLDAVKETDLQLGRVLKFVETNATLRGKTAIILTADHGGSGHGHGDKAIPAHYIVPLYVWGPGVKKGGDLYALNQSTRSDPGTAQKEYTAAPQPIRHADSGNLALKLLGLPAIKGSTINANQELKIF